MCGRIPALVCPAATTCPTIGDLIPPSTYGARAPSSPHRSDSRSHFVEARSEPRFVFNRIADQRVETTLDLAGTLLQEDEEHVAARWRIDEGRRTGTTIANVHSSRFCTSTAARTTRPHARSWSSKRAAAVWPEVEAPGAPAEHVRATAPACSTHDPGAAAKPANCLLDGQRR